jgi:hypothetical protein
MKQFMESEEMEVSSVAMGNGEVEIDANGVGHMIVPLTKLLGCASAGMMYPDYKMGQTRLELELEDKLTVAYVEDTDPFALFVLNCNNQNAVNEITGVTITYPMTAEAPSQFFVVGRSYSVNYSVNGGAIATSVRALQSFTRNAGTGIVSLVFTAIIDVANGANITAITIEPVLETGAFTVESPIAGGAGVTPVSEWTVEDATTLDFPVGKKIELGFWVQTTAGAQATDQYDVFTTVVKSAVADGANVVLTTQDSYEIPANKRLNEVFVFGAPELEPVKWSFQKVELIQAKPIQKMEVPEFVFQTHLLEMINHPAVSQFRRQVELESGTDMLVAINQRPGSLLGWGQYETYRPSLNSVDVITKDIVIDSVSNGSLYYDQLLYCLEGLKRLHTRNGTVLVAVYPVKIEPEQALIPQNVVEYRWEASELPEASIWYFFKRNTRVF